MQTITTNCQPPNENDRTLLHDYEGPIQPRGSGRAIIVSAILLLAAVAGWVTATIATIRCAEADRIAESERSNRIDHAKRYTKYLQDQSLRVQDAIAKLNDKDAQIILDSFAGWVERFPDDAEAAKLYRELMTQLLNAHKEPD